MIRAYTHVENDQYPLRNTVYRFKMFEPGS